MAIAEPSWVDIIWKAINFSQRKVKQKKSWNWQIFQYVIVVDPYIPGEANLIDK